LEILKGKLNDLRNENKTINLGLIKIREAIQANEFQIKKLKSKKKKLRINTAFRRNRD